MAPHERDVRALRAPLGLGFAGFASRNAACRTTTEQIFRHLGIRKAVSAGKMYQESLPSKTLSPTCCMGIFVGDIQSSCTHFVILLGSSDEVVT